MKRTYLGILALVVVSALMFTGIPRTSASGSVHCVATESRATSAPCSNATTYTTLQAAADAAASGDEIRVTTGTYGLGTQFSVMSVTDKSLTVRGGYVGNNWQSPSATAQTVLDGEGVFTAVSLMGSMNMTLERLTIRNGNGQGGQGGGIYANLLLNNTLSLIDVTVTNNRAASAGGIFSTASTWLTRTHVISNTATEDGGGFLGGNLHTYGGSFVRNTAARHAGALGAEYLMQANHTLFADNRAVNGNGGAIVSWHVEMTGSTVLRNSAGSKGGALFLNRASEKTTLVGSLVANNTAQDGAAIFLDSGSFASIPYTLALTNTTIASTLPSTNTAIVLGLMIPAGVIDFSMQNSVVTSYTTAMRRHSSATVSGDYNAFFGVTTDQLVEGTPTALPFTNLLRADPLFVDPTNDDFHLQATSPLRDAGDPAFALSRAYDLDGYPMPVGGRVDIGADEYINLPKRAYLPLMVR